MTDALSEALSAVRVSSAVFYHALCRAPWGFSVPDLRDVGPLLVPGGERLVGYHLVIEGRALVRFQDSDDVPVVAGDLVIVPHGDAHTVRDGSPARLVDSRAELGKTLAGELTTVRVGGDGARTCFVCGYFACERNADRLFLAGLPKLVKVHVRSDPAGAWLEGSVRHLVSEAASAEPGRSALLSRTGEALFVETLRRYMRELPSGQTGWLAGARDPQVGRAIAALHRDPSRRWTLDALAAEAGASRSVLAERFHRLVGEPPLTYQARWRLQLAARRIRSTRDTVLEVALAVGYASEAAFARAFKREFGMPPAQFRRAT
jgi:AraC-like DNA-binding protein